MPYMESQTCAVRVLSPPKLLLTLSLCLLLTTVSVRGNYNFTIRFYEFRNPLGLQCGECGNGGQPACCDDVNRTENCVNEDNGPLRCDTRFRFLLRPFGEPVETAPNRRFPHFHSGNFLPNSINFTEGPKGLQDLPNPFTITNASKWTGGVQFFIDALDRAVQHRPEIGAIINRFPINLELTPGPNFTERTTYTGIYNISGVEFDMSFRVQCSENYYGPNCVTFCEPIEEVYRCDSEGKRICLTQNNRDPTTNCMTCLPGYDPLTNCATQTTTTTSDSGIVISTTNAVTAASSSSAINITVVGGAVGGAAVLLILLLVMLCVVIVIMTLQLRKQRRKFTVAGTISGLNNAYLSRDSSVKEAVETARLGTEHDFTNPLYDESKQNGSKWEGDNSAYSKLQRPPVQKSFVPPKFPYTMEHAEEVSYQLDVAGKGADDAINNEQPAYDIAYPPPPPPSFNETGGAYDVTSHPNHHQFLGASPSALAGGIYNLANYPEESVYDDTELPPGGSIRLPRNDYADITDVPGSTMTTARDLVAQHDYADIPDPLSSSKAAAAPLYDYADTALSMSSPPPPAAADDPMAAHEYAETDDVMKGSHDASESPSVAYANTTAGKVTPEAMGHYDLGQ